jgi:O-antigen/teichoic acid export membrane protein
MSSSANQAGVVVRGSTFRVVGYAASILVSFFLMPFLVHSLGDRIYGYWALAGAILGYYGILDLGIVSAVQYHVAKALGEKDPESANRAISTSFCTFAALGSLVLLATGSIALAAGWFIANPAEAQLFRIVFLIVGIGFAVGFPGRAFIGAISAHLRWDLISGVGVMITVLRTILIVAGIKAGYGIVLLASATVAADILTYALYYLILRNIQAEFHLSFALASWRTLREVVQYSAYTLITKVSDQLRFYVNTLIVSAFVSVVAVTHYAIASRLALSFLDLMIAIMGMLAPWFSLLLGVRDYAGIRRVLAFGTKISVATSTLVACSLVLYGRGFIHAWMGASYQDAYWPLVLLVVSIFFDVAQLPSVSYMFGVSRHRFLAYQTLGEGLANAVLSLALVRSYGLIGVAMGAAIPMIVCKLFIQPVYVCRQSGIPLKKYYLDLLGRSALVPGLAMSVPWVLLFSRIVSPTLFSIGVAVGLQLLLATAFSYALLFDRGERQTIGSTVFGRKPKLSQSPVSRDAVEISPGLSGKASLARSE